MTGSTDGGFRLSAGGLEVAMREDPIYMPISADNDHPYVREIILAERHWTAVEIEVRQGGAVLDSAVLLVPMACPGPREGSAVGRRGIVYLAAGNEVVALALPSLHLLWRAEADPACVFGLMEIEGDDDLLVHGELQITRLGLDGAVRWQRDGNDIFTGGCGVHDGVVVAVDWTGREYRWRLADGEVVG
jgi:hypothetical protein